MVTISWAEVEGVPRHVRDFGRDHSGSWMCLACGQALTAKRGAIAPWHFAHQPGSDACELHSAETKRHLEAKLALYRALGSIDRLSISVGCRRESSPVRTHLDQAHLWLEGWDRVEVECRVGSKRPDLVLFRGDKVVGAVEVRVSHRVSEAKMAAFAEMSLPWIEVGPEAVDSWSPPGPLVVFRAEPGGWMCPLCEARRRFPSPQAGPWEASRGQTFRRAERDDLLKRVWSRNLRLSWTSSTSELPLQISDSLDEHGLPVMRFLVAGGDIVLARAKASKLAWAKSHVHMEFQQSLDDFREELRRHSVESELVGSWELHDEAYAFHLVSPRSVEALQVAIREARRAEEVAVPLADVG